MRVRRPQYRNTGYCVNSSYGHKLGSHGKQCWHEQDQRALVADASCTAGSECAWTTSAPAFYYLEYPATDAAGVYSKSDTAEQATVLFSRFSIPSHIDAILHSGAKSRWPRSHRQLANACHTSHFYEQSRAGFDERGEQHQRS